MIPRRLRVVDSHTAGEPTRVLIDGAPEVVGKTMAEKREHFRRELDWVRTATVCEPRGHEAMVGALLCEPAHNDCAAGVVFFNNVDCLHGCVHATIGVAVTLAHLGRIGPGIHRLDTPTGVVSFELTETGAVTVRNVRSYRLLAGIRVAVPEIGAVTGDVAWGGNWFFLTDAPAGLAVEFRNRERLTDHAWAIRQALKAAGITGEAGAEIDHIELFGPPADPALADSRNFVLCPGKAYDRSPCGTGTSAKLACLHADGRLQRGMTWRQAGILNTVFNGSVEPAESGGVHPSITGSASITGEAGLILDPADPFALGIPTEPGI
ncbi:MAG: proline racemase family protein [Verrucomicrobiales bacterium]|nr:proline racemase family protein [Verrucomicrobiales bacterium]